MIFPELGEIGVHLKKGQPVRLRPSFYSMSKLGSPTEIVEIYAEVMSEYENEKLRIDQHKTALGVIYACAEDSEDRLEQVFGCYVVARDGKTFKYKLGQINPLHILPLARSLMRHGVVGAVPPLPRSADKEPEYLREFHAREHAATAMAHLGMSERDAWACTMTSLVLALRQKYPPTSKEAPGIDAPSAEEFDAAMEWAAKIDKLRGE